MQTESERAADRQMTSIRLRLPAGDVDVRDGRQHLTARRRIEGVSNTAASTEKSRPIVDDRDLTARSRTCVDLVLAVEVTSDVAQNAPRILDLCSPCGRRRVTKCECRARRVDSGCSVDLGLGRMLFVDLEAAGGGRPLMSEPAADLHPISATTAVIRADGGDRRRARLLSVPHGACLSVAAVPTTEWRRRAADIFTAS